MSRSPGRIAGICFVLTLLLLAALGLQYRSDPFQQSYVSDALSYDQWARRIATLGVGEDPVFHQSPLFPILLGTLYSWVDAPLRKASALGLQAFLLASAIGLLVPLGRRYLGSISAGLGAAVVAICYGPFLFYGLKLLPVPLALCTQSAALLLLAMARETDDRRTAFACGAAWGLAALARAETLLFLPFWLAALALPTAFGRPRRGQPAVALLGLVLFVAPATLHNLGRGDFVLIASAAGENLYAGNQRGADGGHSALDPRAGDLFSQREIARVLAEEAGGRALRPSEVSDYWRGRALQEIRAAPGAWLRLEARKLARILDPGDPTDMYSYPLERRRYLTLLFVLPVTTWGLWGLALIGGAIALREQRSRSWPLIAFVGSATAALLVFFVSTRLRVPLLFFLTPFAGLAAARGFSALREGGSRRLLAAGVLVGLAGLAGVDIVTARPSPRETVRLSSVLSTQERLDEALGVLDGELSASDPDPLVLDQAGWIHQKRDEYEDAAGRYRAALQTGLPEAREPQTRSRLATVLEKSHQPELAAREHDRAVSLPHADAGTWFERGRFRLRRGQDSTAVADFRRAARLAPDWDPPRAALRSLGITPPPRSEPSATPRR